MNTKTLSVALLGLGGLANAAAQDAAPPKISDFLADTGATYVGAAGIISLDDKLVTSVSTPKDFVVSLGQGKNSVSQNGFGIAFAPGRSKFQKLAVDISQYGKDDPAGLVGWERNYAHHWRRLLNSTTLSYAENKRSIDPVDYRQKAVALHVEYFLNFNDDPAVAAYRWIIGAASQNDNPGDSACQSLASLRKATSGPSAAQQGVTATLNRQDVKTVASGVPGSDPVPNLALEHAALKKLADGMRPKVVLARARAGADGAQGEAQKQAEAEAEALKAVEDTQKLVLDCADEALKKSRAKWNSTKFTLLWGKGSISATQPGAPRYSLGTHVQLGFQIAPPDPSDSLFTFTARRAAKAVDVDSLNTAPTYKSSSLIAARYTYGYNPGRTLYYLAEISNASAKNATVASGAFKYAIGVDKKLDDSMWLELRIGKSLVRTGETSETKAMANLKFSFDSELAGLRK